MRLLRLLCTYYTEVQYYNKTSFTEQRSWENRTNQPSMEWWSPRLEAGQSAEIAGPLWRHEHIQRGGRGYQSHNLCLYTNLLNFTCSLVTHQTGDSYLCIVCVWFTFSCTLVPKKFCYHWIVHLHGSVYSYWNLVRKDGDNNKNQRTEKYWIYHFKWALVYHYSWPGASSAVGSALQSPVTDLIWPSLRDAIAAPLSVAPDLASSPAKTKTNDKNTDW